MGFVYQLKNKKILETSIFYQYSLGDLGYEGIKNPSFLGIRGVYWFTIR